MTDEPAGCLLPHWRTKTRSGVLPFLATSTLPRRGHGQSAELDELLALRSAKRGAFSASTFVSWAEQLHLRGRPVQTDALIVGPGDDRCCDRVAPSATRDASRFGHYPGVLVAGVDTLVDPSGTVARFADAPGRYLPLAATLAVDRVAGWLRLHRDAAADETDVVLLPYLDGERTPTLPRASGGWETRRGTTVEPPVERDVDTLERIRATGDATLALHEG